MTTIVAKGDRLLTSSGRESWLKRGSVPFNTFGGEGIALLDRHVSYASLYETQPWVAIAVNKIARQIARLPLVVYEPGSRPNEKTPVELDHPLVQLLSTPWVGGSANRFKQKLAFQVLLHGNCVFAKASDETAAPPSRLVPFDWRQICPEGLPGDPVMFWEVTSPDGSRTTFSPSEIVHLSWESPDGWVGVSPLKQLQTTLALEDAAQRYGSMSFKNGARPGGAFILPAGQNLDAAQRQELRTEIQRLHEGADNAGKTMLLSGGASWEQMTNTAVEAELIDQRKLTREEIVAVYDIPPPMVGILDNATYSNIETQHKMLYTDVLGPWLDMIEDTLQAQLIDTEPVWRGLKVEFDPQELLKGSVREEIDATARGVESGLLTPNEARQQLGRAPVEDPAADRLYMPTNNMGAIGDEPVSKRHLDRALHRALTAHGVGKSLFDRERFVREHVQDAGNLAVATELADRLEPALAAATSPDEIRATFAGL